MIHVQSDDRRRAATIPARMGVPIQYVITKPGAESQTLGFCRSRYDWCDDRRCYIFMDRVCRLSAPVRSTILGSTLHRA
jgi:hypothetical protein